MSSFKAILSMKCPKCREGKLFAYPSYAGTKMMEMNESCPVCKTGFKVEPGFYYGAMYISYGFNVALVIAVGVALNIFLEDAEVWIYILTVTVSILLLFPLIFRYSRTMYLHWFGGIKYDERFSVDQN
ncbi:MAG: DUF983 domain-containing protein [Bacteroidota bacterium]